MPGAAVDSGDENDVYDGNDAYDGYQINHNFETETTENVAENVDDEMDSNYDPDTAENDNVENSEDEEVDLNDVFEEVDSIDQTLTEERSRRSLVPDRKRPRSASPEASADEPPAIRQRVDHSEGEFIISCIEQSRDELSNEIKN